MATFIVLKKISAILLAVLILSSNLSIALSTHFCGGKAVKSELSIGSYDLDCGMADMESCAPQVRGFNEIIPIPCCQDLHSFFQINDQYKSASKVQFGLLPQFVFNYFIPAASSFVFASPKIIFKTYKPPLPKQAVSILHQVFRI